MKKIFALMLVLLAASTAFSEPVKHNQCYTSDELTILNKENVAGGKEDLIFIDLIAKNHKK